MFVKKIKTNNFKNLSDIEISPHKGFNLLLGDNAQGKTNILENIFLMTGCKSFRTRREKDFPRFGESFFETFLEFENTERVQKIEYRFRKEPKIEKNIKLNGVKLCGKLPLFEAFKCILFLPDDTEIINNSPSFRRYFIDYGIACLNPTYNSVLIRFNNVLKTRNEVLKKLDNPSLLEVYDNELVKYGVKIYNYRKRYIEILKPIVKDLYSLISKNEELNVSYNPNVTAEKYAEKLHSNIQNDIRLGFTNVGVNKDDVSVNIGGKSARDFASTGQRKSAALVLKLAQSKILSEKSGDTPIILLDDVMAELDENRRELIYDVVSGCQCFVTACNDNFKNADIIYNIKNGKIFSFTEQFKL
jgi:DNA replication and repair protein RecF